MESTVSSNIFSTTAAHKPSTPCGALDTLPAEIRNKIYALVFSSDHDSEVNLLDAKPPSKSLALTCRRVYGETRALYQEAYRQYWASTNFSLPLHVNLSTGWVATLPDPPDPVLCQAVDKDLPFYTPGEDELFEALNEQDLQHMRNFKVEFTFPDPEDPHSGLFSTGHSLSLVDPRGIWVYESYSSTSFCLIQKVPADIWTGATSLGRGQHSEDVQDMCQLLARFTDFPTIKEVVAWHMGR